MLETYRPSLPIIFPPPWLKPAAGHQELQDGQFLEPTLPTNINLLRRSQDEAGADEEMQTEKWELH